MRIAVIGAGIGGLSVARGLQRAGAEVTVLERSPEPRAVGAGLSIFGNGVRALDALGLGAELRSIAPPLGAIRGGQRRPDGGWLTVVPGDAALELRVVERSALHAALIGSLAPGTLRTGRRVLGADADGTLRSAADGGAPVTERFDLVVAADGIRSTVRASWPGDPGVRYAGYAAWRGLTAHPHELGGEAGETWGRGLRFGIAPLPAGRVYWFGVASMPADARIADEAAELRRLFAGWHDPIPALLDDTPADAITRLPVEELAGDLATFRRGRVVLLGDAAHAMTPNLGQGGGQALEDAAVLVAVLGGLAAQAAPEPAAVDAALDRYDRMRRPRAQSIARRSRAVGRVAQLRGRGAVALRDLALRLTPSGALARQALSVQRWAPPTA